MIFHTWSLQLFFTILISIFTQIAFYRINASKDIYKSLKVGFQSGLICSLLINYLQPQKFPILIGNIIIFILFTYTYFHWINMGETARRVRILHEIGSVKNGLTLKELENKYSPKQILIIRLKRLIAKDQILFDGQSKKYYKKNMSIYLLATVVSAYSKLLQKILYLPR